MLEEQAFVPLGAVEKVKSDVRVIAATNKNLDDRVAAGEFRYDLFYRITDCRSKSKPRQD